MLDFRNWNFLALLLIGDTIHLVLTIIAIKPGKTGRSGKLGQCFRPINQKRGLAQESESDAQVHSRSSAQTQHQAPGQRGHQVFFHT